MSAEGLIRRARLELGLSQAELARLAGVLTTSVSKAERNPNPSVRILDRYGRAMGLSLEVFYRAGDPDRHVIGLRGAVQRTEIAELMAEWAACRDLERQLDQGPGLPSHGPGPGKHQQQEDSDGVPG